MFFISNVKRLTLLLIIARRHIQKISSYCVHTIHDNFHPKARSGYLTASSISTELELMVIRRWRVDRRASRRGGVEPPGSAIVESLQHG